MFLLFNCFKRPGAFITPESWFSLVEAFWTYKCSRDILLTPRFRVGPPPPGPSNPYNSAVPPMQVANDPVESRPGKGQEMGKKFGKKLGNAAIFGAGATIGGNIVNSIF
jgi:hypothetical protein